MNDDDRQDHDCDLCGSGDAAEIEVARAYTDGQPLHVCKNCGFVYVRRRRSARRIAEAWSQEIFGAAYTARIPAVVARQVYVAEFVNSTVGLGKRTLCDLGAGEGQFAEIASTLAPSLEVFAVEPSTEHCRAMTEAGIACFNGTIEDFAASDARNGRRFDIVTIMWTLENCQSCRAMLDAAHELTTENGYVVVATGSRILVPFKKPLHAYFSRNPADTHCFRFSTNTLRGALAESGFEVTHVNHYLDTDYLVMIGTHRSRTRSIPWKGDDWRQVLDYFRRWDRETREHYPVNAEQGATS